MENKKSKLPECPVCKTNEKVSLIENRKDNGIIGPGFASWVVDAYYSCKKCGIRFDKK